MAGSRAEDELGQDVRARLLARRILLLGGAIDDGAANRIIAQLLLLEAEDPDRVVRLHVNSRGGALGAGFAIYDSMRRVRPPVSTVCLGEATGTAALILAAGAKGQRFAVSGARIGLKPDPVGFEGRAEDVLAQAKDHERLLERLCRALADHTGRHFEEVEHEVHAERTFSAVEARAFGLVDEVLS